MRGIRCSPVNSIVSMSPSLPDGVLTGCTVVGTHRIVGKGNGVEAGGCRGVLVVPCADCVLGHGPSLRHGFAVTQVRIAAPTHARQGPGCHTETAGHRGTADDGPHHP